MRGWGDGGSVLAGWTGWVGIQRSNCDDVRPGVGVGVGVGMGMGECQEEMIGVPATGTWFRSGSSI